MSAEEQVGNMRGPLSPGISESVERFRSSLAKAREADRYRMLAELLDQLAKDSQADSNGGALARGSSIRRSTTSSGVATGWRWPTSAKPGCGVRSPVSKAHRRLPPI